MRLYVNRSNGANEIYCALNFREELTAKRAIRIRQANIIWRNRLPIISIVHRENFLLEFTLKIMVM